MYKRQANFGANCGALTFTTEVQENNMGQSFGIDYDELNNRIFIGETGGDVAVYDVGTGNAPTNLYTGQGKHGELDT